MLPEVLSALEFLIMLFSFSSTSVAGVSAMGFGAFTGLLVRICGIYEHGWDASGGIFYNSKQTYHLQF